MRSRPSGRAWRSYNYRQRVQLGAQLAAGGGLHCPECAEVLEAEPSTRLAAVLPAGTRGFDLACRGCRRFLPRLLHSPASTYGMRLRRLASAIRRA